MNAISALDVGEWHPSLLLLTVLKETYMPDRAQENLNVITNHCEICYSNPQ